MTTETIKWFKPERGELPDSDRDVLLNVEHSKVWPGYMCPVRKSWVLANGLSVVGRVIEWSEMPKGSAHQLTAAEA
jgi:hypothetical protein